MNIANDLWVEKYRPTKLEDMVLNEKTYEFIKKCIERKTIPHFLFYGKQGMGKTSLAKIIAKEIEADYIYINASDTRGIDTVRDEIKNFVQLMPSNGKMQIVILDEFDGFTPDAMRALRNILEEYSETNRFIFTCNDISRVIDPIRSRVQEINISDLPIKKCVERCVFILKNQKIELSAKNKEIITQKVKNYYPDLRKIVHELQTSLNLELNINEGIETIDNLSKKLFENLKSHTFLEIRKYIIENEKNFDGNYYSLLKKICEVIFYSDLDPDKVKKCFLEISDALYKSKNCSDPEINFSSCIAKIQDIIKT